jgi:hypothetical protein
MRSRENHLRELGARGHSVAGHVNYAASKGGITLFIDGGMTLYPGFETGG